MVFTKDQYRQDKVIEIVRNTLFYFGVAYQNFVVIEELENEYHAVFGINACSYIGAGKFVDNNAAYIRLKEMIMAFTGDVVTFLYDQTVLFEDQLNKGNNYMSITNA